MKKLTLYMMILISTINLYSQNNGFKIIGNIPDLSEGDVRLFQDTDAKFLKTKLQNGYFELVGKINYPKNVVIFIKDKSIQFFLENSIIQINTLYKDIPKQQDLDDPEKFYFKSVSGSKTNQEYENYYNYKKNAYLNLNKIMDSYEIAKNRGDTTLAKKFLYDYRRNMNYGQSYIEQNPDKYISTYVLFNESSKLKNDAIIHLVKIINPKLYDSPYLTDVLSLKGIGWSLIDKADLSTSDGKKSIYNNLCECISKIEINPSINYKKQLSEFDSCLKKIYSMNYEYFLNEYKRLELKDKNLTEDKFFTLFENEMFKNLENNCENYNKLYDEIENKYIK